MTFDKLVQFAQQHDIIIDEHKLPGGIKGIAFSAERMILLDAGKLLTPMDKLQVLAHELGHFMTGSFYNSHTAEAIIEQCERKADAWARNVLDGCGVDVV